MNDADTKVKQQVIEKIKSSTNILVTVSRDPSVDDLSAALGLTALLNKLGKHATAIFSGAIPPAITFLDPEKTFEDTADSLRDFIIALNKEKADHLRYKVEGDVVKIFITPYRTTITGDDLEFSQGDYNVELVLALGVSNQESLDTALEAHGRILHDATVANIDAGGQASQLGSIDWRDENASSLSEMIVGISEAFKTDKPLLDEQIATALLTGIVAATDRFSNPRTTSKVMTMAAQLMAAGADQQLIAAKLEESHEIGTTPTISINEKGEARIIEDTSVKLDDEVQSTLPPDTLSISHDDTAEEVTESSPATLEEVAMPASTDISTLPTDSTLPPEAPPVIAPIAPGEGVGDTQSSTSTLPPADLTGSPSVAASPTIEPSLGGTLNATTDQAADDARRELEDQQNKTILTHSYLGGSEPSRSAPINGVGQTENGQSVDIFAQPPAPTSSSTLPPDVVKPEIKPLSETQGPITPISSDSRDGDEARAAVEAALSTPSAPAPALDLPPPPPLPDFSTLPPPLPDFNAPAVTPTGPTAEPERLGDIFAPEPTTPPLAPPQDTPPDTTAPPDDPGQFRIPGQ